MDMQETNREKQSRTTLSEWAAQNLHKQPDPEPAAALAPFTALLTAQTVVVS